MIPSTIKVDDLLVGENESMMTTAAVWGLLYQMKQKYLQSFIARMEKDPSDITQMVMPLFKIILFSAQQVQEYTNKDKRILDALHASKMRHQMREMFGEPPDEG